MRLDRLERRMRSRWRWREGRKSLRTTFGLGESGRRGGRDLVESLRFYHGNDKLLCK